MPDQRPPVSANEEQLSNLFSERYYYEMPRFQRAYAWDIDEYADFWSDIERAMDGGVSHVHFLGAMVFARNPRQPAVQVLDGQQRITTLMLMIAAMKSVLLDLPDEPEYAETRESLIDDLKGALHVSVTHGGRATRVLRLKANRQDKPCFDALLRSEPVTAYKMDSHRLMKKAYDFLRSKVILLGANPKDQLDGVATLWATLLNSLWYIHIIVEEEINAQVVFESLNAKGEDLSAADLIKNYVFMEIDRRGTEEDLDEAERLWLSMLDSLGKDGEVSDFLRAYWNSRYSFVRSDGLYAALKDKVSDRSGNVWDFLRSIANESKVYSAIRRPTAEFWGSPASQRLFSDLKLLNIRVATSLTMSLWSVLQDQPHEFERYLRLLVHFMVRYSKVAERPSNTVEEQFSEWARAIRDETKTPDELVGWLRLEAPSPELFRTAFSTLKVKSGPTARYLLMKINNAMHSEGEPEEMITNSETATLEHVIPQQPNDEWQRYLKDHDIVLDDVISRIGNLTLLTQPSNTIASNREFPFKRDAIYAQSRHPLNQDLVLEVAYEPDGHLMANRDRRTLSEFGAAEISARQGRLAHVAERVWSMD